jgi:hypothetical protein
VAPWRWVEDEIRQREGSTPSARLLLPLPRASEAAGWLAASGPKQPCTVYGPQPLCFRKSKLDESKLGCYRAGASSCYAREWYPSCSSTCKPPTISFFFHLSEDGSSRRGKGEHTVPSRMPLPAPFLCCKLGVFTLLPLLRLPLARKPLLGSPLHIFHSCLRPHSSLSFLPMWHASARHGRCHAGAFARNPHRAPAYSPLHLT